jgi:hypothetical protein
MFINTKFIPGYVDGDRKSDIFELLNVMFPIDDPELLTNNAE